jgi:DNA-binding MarR family transcriptional regulator
LGERIKQTKEFESTAHEAMLSVLVAASELRERTERVCKKHGLGSSHYNVLRILGGAPEEGYSRGDIIERMLDPSPDVTRLIDSLSEKGLVRRERCEDDRRRTLHWITDAGVTLLDKMHDEITGVHAFFAERFTEAELAELSRLCEKIYTTSDAAVPSPSS